MPFSTAFLHFRVVGNVEGDVFTANDCVLNVTLVTYFWQFGCRRLSDDSLPWEHGTTLRRTVKSWQALRSLAAVFLGGPSVSVFQRVRAVLVWQGVAERNNVAEVCHLSHDVCPRVVDGSAVEFPPRALNIALGPLPVSA